MHTFREWGLGCWEIGYLDHDGVMVVLKRSYSLSETLQLVNYLNGGAGYPLYPGVPRGTLDGDKTFHDALRDFFDRKAKE
jgi:hypothetical protein